MVNNQYLVYRQDKLTEEALAQVDESWLAENGINVDVEQALAAVESGAQGGKEISGRYHHLQSVQYDYGEAFLAGSPAILANRRKRDSDNIQLPVINVANLTPEPQWIELAAMPFGRYKINLAQPEYMQNPNGSYPAVVPRYRPLYGELDGAGFAYVELPLEWRDKEVDIFIEAPGESGWLVFWHNASSLLQIGGGVLMIAAAAGVSATGVGTVIGLGLVAMGADQISAGTQSIWTQQQVKTLGAQGLEFIGVDEQYSELIYSVVPLGGAVLREGTRMALNSTMVRNVQVIAAKSGEQAIKQIRLFGAKIRQRVTLNGHQVVRNNYQYNMIHNPGPLAQLRGNPAANFSGGKYNSRILDEDIILYRAGNGGGGRNALGQWFTEQPMDSISQVRIDLAVKPQWINPQGILTGVSPINTVYKIKIPKGTTIYEGPVGYQNGIYLGGENVKQIYVHEPWNIKNLIVLDSWGIK